MSSSSSGKGLTKSLLPALLILYPPKSYPFRISSIRNEIPLEKENGHENSSNSSEKEPNSNVMTVELTL